MIFEYFLLKCLILNEEKGGPVFDKQANIVGIATSKLRAATKTEKVNYAIRLSHALALAMISTDNLIKSKSLQRIFFDVQNLRVLKIRACIAFYRNTLQFYSVPILISGSDKCSSLVFI